MTYRDDRVALQNRVEALQQELEEARRQGEEHGREEAEGRAQELQQKVDALQRDLADIGDELRSLQGKPRRHPARAALIVAAAASVLAVGAAFALLRSSPPPPAPLPIPQRLVPPSPPPAIEPTPVPVPAPVPAVPPPSEARTAYPRWRASVLRAEGLALAPGTPCSIEATLQTSSTNARVPGLVVTCAGQKLYDARDALNGMSALDDDARERLGPRDDRSTFSLQYSDVGTRTGARAQIDLDSTKRRGAAFRETLPRYRVELSIPVESEPTAPLAGEAQRLHRAGKLSEVTGALSVKAGASCVLRAMPTGQGTSCVAEVVCGGTTLFPVTAAVRCTYDGARPIGVASDGGPRSIAIEGSSLEVKAEGAGAFRALIALDGS